MSASVQRSCDSSSSTAKAAKAQIKHVSCSTCSAAMQALLLKLSSEPCDTARSSHSCTSSFSAEVQMLRYHTKKHQLLMTSYTTE
eukprot:13998-Heterococcus_DN1.PRE.3